MSTARLEQLLKFLEEDPSDPFTLYGIALEYSKTDDQKSLDFFDKLLKEHEGYIPSYYHAGKLYQKLGKAKEAEKIYLKGMDLSKIKGNHHAYNELQSAYNVLKGFDDDE